ncbi:hypothetical protein H4582DRAFT_2051941 [Lactarius indigo]|nr:hypothetical protein H4582DRAFT_2051941 [Lactarius indigo]
MATIPELEQSLDAVLSESGPSNYAEALDMLLCSYIGDSNADADGEANSDSEALTVDGATGNKHMLFVIIQYRRTVWQLCNIKETEEAPTETHLTSPMLTAGNDELEYQHAAAYATNSGQAGTVTVSPPQPRQMAIRRTQSCEEKEDDEETAEISHKPRDKCPGPKYHWTFCDDTQNYRFHWPR